ncbi:hypothetical protein DNU06_16740 [Putridiphycobacter roseus]|uniref:Peptidase M28 domain-containing protein n=1 Tax=Putridiphycobacter roseus TaxID=2219161 RepID=A0A2W1NJ89_9FLAO|nr:M28 family peptidase [Putridiphycobacter roseus]PZE15692.1 hypothetical protein DNU06_16740 [Putridiphycobacter roseus]
MKIIISIFFICNLFFSWGQKQYAESILNDLCSDYYAGRGYVEDGVDKAGNYLIKAFKNIGVAPFPGRSYSQNYTFDVNTFPKDVAVQLDKETLVAGVDYLVDANSGKTVGTYEPINISINNYTTDIKQLKNSLRFKTILVFDARTIKSRDSIQAYHQLAIASTKYYPIIWVSDAKLMYSVGRQQYKNALITVLGNKYTPAKKITIQIEPEFKKDFENKNIIGFIPGKKDKKYIVLTGHYDHLGKMGQAMFPGANDNASGVAMLLSLAKYYTLNRPKYSLVIILFSGEEAGLEGSKYFVNHPFFPLEKIKFLLNVDIMGSASDGITVVNGNVHPKYFKKLEKLNKKGNYLPLVKKRGPTQNSDHYFFSQTGVPSFFVYTMGDCKNYHDVYDTAAQTSLNNFDQVLALFIDFIDKM